jgi:hypothetical protein
MEVLFVVAIILVAYTAYSVLDKSGESKKSPTIVARTPTAPQTKSEPSATVAAPAAKKEVRAQEAKPASGSVSATGDKTAVNLRDPKTGEIASIPANYRFAKRWIKDALVAEGLLDKVYKNSDLDDTNAAKVKGALDKLKAMSKYQA